MPLEIPIPNRLFFFNTGVITPICVYRRRWKANKEYGFVSAGHNKKSGETIQRLDEKNIICAYISKLGFVCIGQIESVVESIGQSFLHTLNRINDYPLLNHDNINGVFANLGDGELQEYVAKVNWLREPMNNIATKVINPNRPETIRFCSTQNMGLNIYPGVCCELREDNPRQTELIEFVFALVGVLQRGVRRCCVLCVGKVGRQETNSKSYK
jgi:uncharacterized protein YsxB (DUF464 family)